MERGGYRGIDKVKIGLYNSNPTSVINDINAKCIVCSAEKRGKNPLSNQI
jgi:hypothetical protein